MREARLPHRRWLTSPGLVFGRAKLLQAATVALGFAGLADLAAVVDDLVGEVDPASLRQNTHQLQLDLFRRLGFGQAEATRDAEDVRVHHHAFGFVEGYAEDDVGSFARHAGDGD